MSKRIRSIVALGLLAGCAGLSACSSDGESKELDAQLQEDTGVFWTLERDPRSHEYRFMAPSEPIRIGAGTPEEMARAFFDRYRDSLHGTGMADELRAIESISDDGHGSQYVRFEHYLPGTDIPVFDVRSSALFTKDGKFVLAQPGFRGDLSTVSKTAAISDSQAKSKAIARAQAACGTIKGDPKPTIKLGVHALEEGASRLAWQVQLMTQSDRCIDPTIVVDATNGDILEVRDSAHRLADRAPGAHYHLMNEATDIKDIAIELPLGSTHYQLSDPTTNPIKTTWSYAEDGRHQVVQSDTLGQWDVRSSAPGAAVDAHFYTAQAIEYFKKYHGRNGPDGIGGRVAAVVHDPFGHGMNAYYNSTRGEMHCGDGGGDLLPICSAFDVVVHEITHGVTGATSRLQYYGESGALNESFSDVLGASAEFALEGDNPARNFALGERASRNGLPFRDMVNPSRIPFGPHGAARYYPEHYSQIVPCAPGEPGDHERNDNCYVHYNSSIPNRAFSLMTAGGTHNVSKVTVPRGIGWEASRILWYFTFTNLYWSSNFRYAALSQVFLANSWHRASNWDRSNFEAVACAWVGVGVLSASEPVVSAVTNCAAQAPTSSAPPKVASPSEKGPEPNPKADPLCGNRADGWVCSKEEPNSAIRCVAGMPTTTAYCADPDAMCRKASANDPTATVTGGVLTCE